MVAVVPVAPLEAADDAMIPPIVKLDPDAAPAAAVVLTTSCVALRVTTLEDSDSAHYAAKAMATTVMKCMLSGVQQCGFMI